jgi:site-specific DNA recombinase
MSKAGLRFAFVGRCSTEDQQDPESSRAWQLTRAGALIEPHGAIVAEFFDVGQSRSLPWQRRPRSSALLAALRNPERGFEAVVIGEPQRAFYGNQFSLTFPLFVHYGVQLWVPEVGGPLDPENEAHDLVMSVFGGMSKGERSRIKLRVRTAMASQTKLEGRFLGGRPPYGYELVDLGPHPNPAKSADGRRLHGLGPDETTAPVVARIFAEFLAGRGIYLIAEGLTRDGIPCPSAYDRRRNPHRSGLAWSKSAVRVILTNPRYTGRQVWNKQRKDEVLLDVDDVALGHTGVMRWNSADRWIVSNEIVHPPLVDQADFDAAQQLLGRRGRGRRPGQEYHRVRTRHSYIFRGLVYCSLCHRKMQGQRSHGENYYRCRYPQEYALANKVDHPRNVYLRELDLVDPLDAALAEAFAPHRVSDTITAMVESQDQPDTDEASALARSRLSECDRKLARHRAALEAGADPAIVTGWIAEVEAERRRIRATIEQPASGSRRMTREEITATVQQLGDIIDVLREADFADRAEVYQQLGLRLTYDPDERKVRVQSQPAAHPCGESVRVRGGT